MKTTGLTETQGEALLDLVVLGMYVDHNLASAEDVCVQRLLDTFQFSSDYERQQFSDAAFTRARRHTGSADAIRGYVTVLADSLPTREVRQTVCDVLDDLLTSDSKITTEESRLLLVVKQVFQL